MEDWEQERAPRKISLREKTSRLLDRLLAETAAAWQISPSEVRVLLFLSCMPHLDTARDVALHCGMSKASVSGNVLKLVTRGLLTAEMDLTDRRFQRLALTEQAEPVADAIAVTCTAILFAVQFRKALRKLDAED